MTSLWNCAGRGRRPPGWPSGPGIARPRPLDPFTPAARGGVRRSDRGDPRRRRGPVLPMRVLFYGTPRFALPTLDALLAAHEVVGVVTQPDRPAGRGQRVAPPPVKERAVAAGVPVLQPERLRDPRWL